MDREDLHTLDVTRQRLSALLTSIDSLRGEIARSSPLPPWETIAERTSLVTTQFSSILAYLNRHEGFFRSAHAYPLPNFPDLSHEAIISQMLRKKLEPDVENRIDEGLKIGRRVNEAATDSVEGLNCQDLGKVWDEALAEAVTVSDGVTLGIDFTIAEIESEEGVEGVKTGIRRKLDDGMEEVEEGEDGVERPVRKDDKIEERPERSEIPPMELEKLLRFMNLGIMPPGG